MAVNEEELEELRDSSHLAVNANGTQTSFLRNHLILARFDVSGRGSIST
jgi:hypothetical protein